MARRKSQDATENADATPEVESNGKKSAFEENYEKATAHYDKVMFVNDLCKSVMRDQSIPYDDKPNAIDDGLTNSHFTFTDEEVVNITTRKVNDYNGSFYYGYSRIDELNAKAAMESAAKLLAKRGGQSFVDRVNASRSNGHSEGQTPF